MPLTADHNIKQNNTAPVLEKDLLTPAGTPVDLTTASSVHLRIRPLSGGAVVDRVATIVSAVNGTVRYTWITADTAAAGYYVAEWVVTFASGVVESFPNDRDMLILIAPAV